MSSTALPTDSIESTDQAPIPPAANEELAGPAPDTTAPVTREERVSSVDVLRGISLMGILIMNICDFAYGFKNYTYPLSTVKPVFNGPHWKANTTLWFLRWILAEGKMRALFSMLFGAGVILLTGRAESRGAGVRTADIYTRRNMWLVLFGMLHCYLIWNGDILFLYGTCALLFLFPFRHLKPKTLLWTGCIILVFNTLLVNGGQSIGIYFVQKNAAKAHAAEAAHKPLTDDQKSAIESAQKMDDQWRMSEKSRNKDIDAHHGYAKAFIADAPDGFQGETLGGYPFFAGDWLGMMLIGMALFHLGFFSLKLSTKTYVLCAVIGLGISWPMVGIGAYHAWKSGFDHLQTFLWLQVPYDIGRIPGTIGNAAVILLLVRAASNGFGLLRWLLARCAAVGQMAFSNYILTSISMRTLFVWSKLHWYGYLDYYKIYWIVAAMWIVNLTFSTLWLRYFRFGPIEWCWRSLTYWKRQPMLLRPQPEPIAPPVLEPAS
jgi:uncharacterized protein